jgi:hypothetical protein
LAIKRKVAMYFPATLHTTLPLEYAKPEAMVGVFETGTVPREAVLIVPPLGQRLIQYACVGATPAICIHEAPSDMNMALDVVLK